MLPRKLIQPLCTLLFVSAALLAQNAKLKEIKPGWNLFKKEQDIQMGREYAQQIERELDVINGGPLTAYVQELGQKIATQPLANGFPYTFKVVNDPTINAFALPGGPIYLNSGLILNAENEGQLMGVIAHEVSHIALRHSTNQVTKSYAIQIPAMIAGVYGQMKGGITGMLTQLGVGLGANGILMKFSRGAEQQADLLGARMMNNAGYNPIEMARFFEILEAQSGKKGGSDFFSSHPNPGNRSKYVSEEVTLLPRREYSGDTGKFAQMKQLAKGLPAPKKRPQAAQGGGQMPPQPGSNGDGSRTYSGEGFRVTYPENWIAFGEANAPMITIAPQDGVSQNHINLGVVAAHYEDDDNRFDHRADTERLIGQIIQQNPDMNRNQRPQISQHQVNGRNVMVARLLNKSNLDGGTEVNTLVTFPHRNGMFYMVFIAPERQMNQIQGTFDRILTTLQLN
jgi:Zn-dependent protease with chaperone function